MSDRLLDLKRLPDELQDLIITKSESFQDGYTMVKVAGISIPLHFKRLSELRAFLTLYIPSYKIKGKENLDYERRLCNTSNKRRVSKTVSRDSASRIKR